MANSGAAPAGGAVQSQAKQGAGPTQQTAPAAGSKNAAGVPMWLDPAKFDAPDFNAETCIADLRRYVPLTTLKTELEQYVQSLKTKLVEVINDDYNDYVSLSTRLVNVDGAVTRMRKPLTEVQERLHGVQDSIKAELALLQSGLEHRQEVAGVRSTLELLQEVAHVASKVDKLLTEVEGVDMNAGDLDAHSRMLERVAGEAARLMFLAARGQDLAFVKTLEHRIGAARAQLESHLAAVLTQALQQQHWSAASHCLHGYVELGDAGKGEQAIRSVLVAPLVGRVVKEHKRAHATEGAEGEGLGNVLRAALAALHDGAGPLLEALLSPSSGLGLFDVLGNCILAEVTEEVAQALPGMFSPGNPPSFHANFTAGQSFLASLERLARTRAAVEKLRASSAYAAFGKRWNLAVYFSLQYQEIAGSLEDAASAPTLSCAPQQPTTHAASSPAAARAAAALQLAVSATLWTCLQRVASPTVFLPQLGDRFLKLAFQLLARYRSWLTAVVDARRLAAVGGGAGAGVQAGPPHGSSAATAATAPAAATAGSAGTTAAAAATKGPAAWAGAASLEDLVLIAADAGAVAAAVKGSFALQLAELLSGLPPGVANTARSAIEKAADSVAAGGDALLEMVADDVIERCVAVVKQLKGITATYRMTTKGPPTRHSHYVGGVLQPLGAALDAQAAAGLSEEQRVGLARAVVCGVARRYQALAEELLTTVRKTESSLKRLKKNRPDADSSASTDGTGANAAAAMSDSDKICLQLFLDVTEFREQVKRYGLEAGALEEYRTLLLAVTPATAGEAQG